MKPDLAIEIIRRLREKGHEAYLVGGCVRDMVMNIEPSDYDIATSALPETIMKIFPHTEPIGAKFGVVLVIIKGRPFEVATFRSDEAYVDGRRPSGVVFTDAKTDVQRRDFTINGLLYDPVAEHVIDYVGGQEDIRNRVVRAIGDPRKRFQEDKLRLLRAVRFGARLGYIIEPVTWSAVCSMASEIRCVSAERIREELARILTEGQAAAGFSLLHRSGMLPVILPALSWNEHLERCLDLVAANSAADFAFGVLLHDASPDTARSVAEYLRLSGAETQHVVSMVKSLPQFKTLQFLPLSAMKRFLRMPRFQDHLELARICATAANENLEAYNFAAALSRKWSQDDLWPPPVLSGDDLIRMGFTPGPLFKEILTAVEDGRLEGRLNTAEQAVDFVKGKYAR